MDRHMAASLDRWLTTPPEDDEHECDDEDSCGCAANDAELAKQEQAWADYEAAVCVSCSHARYHHGEECFGGTKPACVCSGFVGAQHDQ